MARNSAAFPCRILDAVLPLRVIEAFGDEDFLGLPGTWPIGWAFDRRFIVLQIGRDALEDCKISRIANKFPIS
jgi:hypothetical protein